MLGSQKADEKGQKLLFPTQSFGGREGKHGGKLVWWCIRDIQRGRRGLVLARTAVVKDEEGNVCTTMDSLQERGRRHFTKILNIQSQFDAEELS